MPQPRTGFRAARSLLQSVGHYPEPTESAPGCKGGKQRRSREALPVRTLWPRASEVVHGGDHAALDAKVLLDDLLG